MKHGKFVKAVATLAVFTAMGAMMAACGGETHNLTRHDARSATCTQEGNIEYWDCSHCDKLFADEKGEKEVKDIVVPKTPHDIDDEDFHEAVPSDCENDGTFAYYECQACHKKFTNKDGTKEIEDIVDPAAHTSVHAERVEPTLDKAGNKEYWKCTACQKYFLEEEMINPVEEAETVIPKLEEYDVDLTLAVTDKIGQAITDYSAWNNRRVHLTHTNEYLNKTYVAKIGMDGKLSFVTVAQDETETDAASKMGEGTYTVVVTGGGYYEATLTIGKSGNTKTIETEEIEHTFHVGNNGTLSGVLGADGEKSYRFDVPWKTDGENAVYVDFTDGALTGNKYLADFTVKSKYLNGELWTSRFYIAVASATGTAQTGYGFIFGNANDKIIMTNDMTPAYNFGGVTGGVKLNGVENPFDSGAMVEAIKSAEGVHIRIVRNGRNVTFLTNADGEWKQFRTLTLGGDYGARLAFFVTADETITFSNVSFGKYVAQVDPQVGQAGKEAHFKSDGKVYTLTGTETTDNELVLPALVEQSKSFTLVLKKEGETLSVPESFDVSLKPVRGKSYTLTATNGAIENAEIAIGITYTVSIAGYDDITLTITAEQDSYNLVLYKNQHTAINPNEEHPEYLTVERDENEKNVYTFNVPWIATSQADGDKAVIADIKDVSGDTYMADFTVKMSGYTTGWTSRFFVYVASATGDKQVGYGFMPDTDKTLAMIDLFGNNVYREQNGAYKLNGLNGRYDSSEMVNALKSPDGLKMRIAREGRTVNFLAYVNGKWEIFRTLTLTGDYGARLAFAATSPDTISFSDLSYADGYEEQKLIDDDSVQLAYFTKGGKFYVNGVEKAEEELTVNKLASAALTLNVGDGVVAQGKQVVLKNESFGTVEGIVGADGVVTFENAVFGGFDYTLTVEGYAWSYVVTIEEEFALTIKDEEVTWKYSDPAKLSVVNGSGNWANGTLTNNSTADKIAFTAQFPVSKEVAVEADSKLEAAAAYTLFFNLKMTETKGYENRFGLRLTDGSGDSAVGFYFFQKNNGAIEVGALRGKIDMDKNGGEVASSLNASMFASGLAMKAVCEQTTAKLYAYIGGEWKLISTQTLSGKGKIGFSASQGTFEYTDVALAIAENENKTLSLALSDNNGALGGGISVKLTNYRGETVTQTTDEQGVVTLATPYLDEYLVEVNGVLFNVNFSADNLSASKTIKTAWVYDDAEDAKFNGIADAGNVTVTPSADKITVEATLDGANAWKRDEAVLQIGDALAGKTDYIVKFTLTANFKGDWSERFGFRVADGNDTVGFTLWAKDNICVGGLFGNVDAGSKEPSKDTGIGKISAASGLEVVLIRNGGNVQMFFKIDGVWKQVGSVTLSNASAAAKIGFVAAGGTYEYSEISVLTVEDTIAE